VPPTMHRAKHQSPNDDGTQFVFVPGCGFSRMKISWRHRQRRRVRSFAITEEAMTPETVGLIENFSCKRIIDHILGCRTVDTHQKDCQECEASHQGSPHIFQELSVGDVCVHRKGSTLYHRKCSFLQQCLFRESTQNSPFRGSIVQHDPQLSGSQQTFWANPNPIQARRRSRRLTHPIITPFRSTGRTNRCWCFMSLTASESVADSGMET
jgi:hypothetical protein